MATGQLNGMIQNLRRSACAHDEGSLTDAQLLDAFLTHSDQLAFEAIVRRHAGMVWGVCRRMLGHAQDAEDAFQAVFLVFVRKATSIWPRAMLGNWLYGVAHRTAMKARGVAMKRRAREKPVVETAAPESEKTWSDLKPHLDRELNRLADKYRVPVILCDLEGKSQREAARQLGWPEGTLMTRLTRARQMLAKRLSQQGLALSGGALSLLLAQNAASAAAPLPVVSATLKTAGLIAAGQATSVAASASVATLAEGVLHGMFLSKLKAVLATMVTVVLLGSVGLVTHQALANRVEPQVNAPLPAPNVDEPLGMFEEEFQERGQPPPRPNANAGTLAGKIVDVANDGKAFTLETLQVDRREPPTKHEIKIDEKTKLTFSSVGTEGAKLAPELSAQVQLADGSKDTAANVTLTGNQPSRRLPDLVGKVVRIARNGNVVSLETTARGRNEEPQIVNVMINARTLVTFSGVTTGGATLKEGHGALVWLEKGSKDTAASITFSDPLSTDRGREKPREQTGGVIVSVAKDGNKVTLELPSAIRGDAPKRVEYKIDDKTQITFYNVGPDGARLTEGQFARVTLAAGAQDTAAVLMASNPPRERQVLMGGMVVRASKDGKTFTIEWPAFERGGKPQTKLIKISDDTRVVYMRVGLDSARPTPGYVAEIWLQEGSATDAAQIIFSGLDPKAESRR